MIDPKTRPYSPEELQTLFKLETVQTQKLGDIVITSCPIQSLPDVEATVSQPKMHRQKILKIAASVCIVAALLYLVNNYYQKSRNKTNNELPKEME